MAPPAFRARLLGAARTNDSWLCVGLDPDAALAPRPFRDAPGAAWVTPFLRGIVEATADLVCCFKPNLAFFEALGEDGLRALREILRAIPGEIPVILDAKRADIGNTSRGYARAIFDDLGADAVTVNPYLGGDSLAPFFAYPDRGVFVLCKTSNPGSQEIQDLTVVDESGSTRPVYQVVARRALDWDQHGTLGLVVGATFPDEARAVRAIAPDVPFLVPGVGAQRGDLASAVEAAADGDGNGAILNASRGVLYADDGDGWQAEARRAATALRDQIRAARGALPVRS